ncbi:UDP-N-acetylmuramoyl-tripeptide--D-alanyl-D-alanine ligase [bacterium (Candidatus Blackallbacteria) CG17_big_fil_post_rev_8_21_14_2_50_48_46]|uniref:UDP-N-acetylmuramoyl-tripeptide--D-alanyl-D-alanine ligase n=1 Tax=bacterium (Candidatus Blackallbacteria) CG17_big_fil_post_rev_8_21_14_2_50_48_46 TaxID=2014261 RepID=A0A2M7FYC0_9BACT|nr:MAG: UDP-N-acetylmuramoyl-tripeptide--D-alanyl-D-alanine ligase [bacterium (Candidatus Blackallbacteria) CG18_big_fil_WC_8_21_14_2_50_49_26]PIW14173.1 MAG: UDP-N-acetylmuramoyl-tripeptide--D-alanyl-D-alanine ligase [bacterium (Candidatus Blackallbacteria) CG17_big_fil_post_rev_8_21_14_2_50_48_46]PIW46714.1 MAG: UDP-N-acetylmuramoyl-tripeptide--D-alanyl-D-alanine ligase [bacterium (Candidatus Blackallbacteria) CG13_big_fil_rev_8_21_14_2_50_49_14]
MFIDIQAFFETTPVSATFAVETIKIRPEQISTDSRAIPEGGLFIPLRGEFHDGHAYLLKSFELGAQAAFCEKQVYEANRNTYADLPLLLVENCLSAYQALARQWRRQLNIPVIGITGSSGKTSTKEILAAVLSPFLKVHKNKANFNNEIGVPKTLLEIPVDAQVAIIEMGMRGQGQITELAEIAEPNLGLITQIGTAHLSELGSQANIADAKWELAKFLEAHQGKLFAQAEDPLQRLAAQQTPQLAISWCGESEDSLVRLLSVTEYDTFQEIEYQVQAGKVHTLQLMMPGRHQVRNLLLCLGVLSALGYVLPEHTQIEPEQLFGRNQIIELPNSATLINDAYNANPESMRATLEVFGRRKAKRKIAVLGKMGELGPQSPQLHAELGKFCSQLELDYLIGLGDETQILIENAERGAFQRLWFQEHAECIQALTQLLAPGDLLLLKASRSAQLEKLIEGLTFVPESEGA